MHREFFHSFALLSRKPCASVCVCVFREGPSAGFKDWYSDIDSSLCQRTSFGGLFGLLDVAREEATYNSDQPPLLLFQIL